MINPNAPRGRKARPAPKPGAEATTPGSETAGALPDANAAPADGDQTPANVGGVAVAPVASTVGDQADEAIVPLSSLPDGSLAVTDEPGTDSQAATDPAAVAAAPEAPADAGAAENAQDGAGAAEAGGPGDGTISKAEAAQLTIRDFVRTEGGEIARDSRGRAIVEERQLRETDVIADRVDGDIVHFVLADGRKISVRK